jgi:simple sugar transport system permease protein
VIRLERRLDQPWWLSVAVPIGSLLVAFAIMAVVLAATGHDPSATYRKIFEAGFTGNGALSATLLSATPILFTGLAAAVAFRMELFNIGAEGQLYLGAVGASWIALRLGDHGAGSTPLFVIAMCVAAGVLGALWALIPGVLRAFANTNEIITSLMLNYVAGYLLTYLIYDSASYWRDVSTLQARAFPQGKPMPSAAEWPTFGSSVVWPLGFAIGLGVAAALWTLYSRTRFGFEVSVIADSPRAARYAGMRTRRKILAVMALSGAVAGLGGASQIGDFSHTLDGSPQGLQAAAFGYTGIVVAALARYNPLAVCLVAVLIGGLLNAGYTLQGPDFPAGLVGVLQGIILFCALGGELFIRYRLRVTRRPGAHVDAGTAPEAAA